MKYLAKAISLIFHPILIPTYSTLLLMYANPFMFGHIGSPNFIFIVRTTILYTVLFPLFTLFLMRRLDFIENFQFFDRKSRIFACMVTVFYFIWTFTVFFRSNFNELLSDIMLGATLSVSFALINASLHKRISMHAIGMGGLVAISLVAVYMAIADIRFVFSAAIICAGLVGTSRLLENAHTPKEVYNGFMVGFFLQAIAFII